MRRGIRLGRYQLTASHELLEAAMSGLSNFSSALAPAADLCVSRLSRPLLTDAVEKVENSNMLNIRPDSVLSSIRNSMPR